MNWFCLKQMQMEMRLGKKIEAVNEKVKNISEAIESMENYSYTIII